VGLAFSGPFTWIALEVAGCLGVRWLHTDGYVPEPICPDAVLYLFHMPQGCEEPLTYRQAAAYQLANAWNIRCSVGMKNRLFAHELDLDLFRRCRA